MPRINKGRTIGRESLVAQRMATLREAHGWSYESLAQRMVDAGCQIQSSALFKIEKGDPPRRITVDELVALAAVFEVPIESLTASPDDVVAEIERLMSELGVINRLALKLQAERRDIDERLAGIDERRGVIRGDVDRLAAKLPKRPGGYTFEYDVRVVGEEAGRPVLKAGTRGRLSPTRTRKAT